MFTSQRDRWAEPYIVALVELDMQKMRVRLVLAREAIRERMRELECSRDHRGERQDIEGTPDNLHTQDSNGVKERIDDCSNSQPPGDR